MMPRLFWKIFLALWLSIMVFMAVMGWTHVVLAQRNLAEPPDFALSRGLQAAETRLGQALQKGGAGAVRGVLQEWPPQLRNHVFLFGPDGHEVLGRDPVRRLVAHDGLPHRSRPLTDAQGRTWELLLLRRPPPGRLLEPGRRGMLYRLLLAGLVSALVSLFLARYLARPLEDLGRATRRLAEGDLAARVGRPLSSRRDEFGRLARDFDDMADRQQRLQQASRRLLRDVSHELRSPLARLRVALELARNRGAAEVGGELDRIELETDRLEALVSEVLDLLRESSDSLPFRPERFDLVELLEDLCEVVEYESGGQKAGIGIRAERPLPVYADRELLWRAIENLLRNALIHGSEAGPVEIEARTLDGGGAGIFIRDSGPGIPEQHLERIFDPFFRVQEARDRQTGGHGLGLAIAAAAVRRHRGSIEARNLSGGGLEIAIGLPGGP